MTLSFWTFLFIFLSFGLYVGIAIWTRVASTKGFYVAGGSVHPILNGAATAADWMSAASFISMAGLISTMGRDGSIYLMGWTGGYVLLALLLAPYLRKFGQFTVPDFVGERYYSKVARSVALICAVFVSFTYIAGQMRGVGIVFARVFEWDIFYGVFAGMLIVFTYAVLGGMKGITYTQVAQYCVLIFAYLVPAIFIGIAMTGHVIPQIGFGAEVAGEPGVFLLDKLDGLSTDLGFATYTDGSRSTIDVFFFTAALMLGTAGLPHVIIRFFTVPKVADARVSAFWALLFISILYLTAPAIAAFARTNILQTVTNATYSEVPGWFKTWENTGLISFEDKNGDGVIQYYNDKNESFNAVAMTRGWQGNELTVDKDIIVLANPEIANLPNWVIALVAAGGLAAALSTAAGLLLVISSSISHDLMKKMLAPGMSEKQELTVARVAAAVAIVIAGYFGVNPPGFVGEVVAFAFGLAASSFFPVLLLGIFSKRMNKEGAIAGMIVGIVFTASYIIYFKFVNPTSNTPDNWWFGISPEGIGTLGMILNFAVSVVVCRFFPGPPEKVLNMIDEIRIPKAE
ncbi:MAG: cation acetate symporter [Verrucomicrobia bacterium]|nr:cation acetate symporter [Verrucomicrobiota bacterium]MDA1069727.1 cation acetate symporter [Verrucomicrobiota bacterium]